MDAFRVNAMTGFISLDLMFQIGAFVEGVRTDLVDASQAAIGEADDAVINAGTCCDISRPVVQ
jgi:hypothetical protein